MRKFLDFVPCTSNVGTCRYTAGDQWKAGSRIDLQKLWSSSECVGRSAVVERDGVRPGSPTSSDASTSNIADRVGWMLWFQLDRANILLPFKIDHRPSKWIAWIWGVT